MTGSIVECYPKGWLCRMKRLSSCGLLATFNESQAYVCLLSGDNSTLIIIQTRTSIVDLKRSTRSATTLTRVLLFARGQEDFFGKIRKGPDSVKGPRSGWWSRCLIFENSSCVPLKKFLPRPASFIFMMPGGSSFWFRNLNTLKSTWTLDKKVL